MNRRKFINKSTKFALASAVPFILPTGRLFAATGSAKIKHIVFCLFAGGIRNWESLEMREGNLMPNTLKGTAKINPNIAPGIETVPRILQTPLQNYGTLFKNFKYASKKTSHYNGHAVAVMGNYCDTIELMAPLHNPSIFEYFRKHSGFGNSGLNTWWVSDQAGPFPFLQYSKHPNYGRSYAANMIHPSVYFKYNFAKNLNSSEQSYVNGLKNILSNSATGTSSSKSYSFNTSSDQEKIRRFLLNVHQKHFSSKVNLWNDYPGESYNDDLTTMFTACEILKKFHPNLLVVNMQDSDVGHTNYTKYCSNLHVADYALGKLWNTIQNDPQLKDNTILIAHPEFGRNKNGNSIIDPYGRYAVDHTGDDVSQQMFCLIAGPKGIIHQNKVSDAHGESIDTLPTIAHLMGFHESLPRDLIKGRILHEAIV